MALLVGDSGRAAMRCWTKPCLSPPGGWAGEEGAPGPAVGFFWLRFNAALLSHVLMLQGKYHRCLMALEIAIPPPCPPRRGRARGAPWGRGWLCNPGRNVGWPETCPGRWFSTLVPSDAFLIRVFGQSGKRARPGGAWGGDAGLCWAGTLSTPNIPGVGEALGR